MIATIPAALFGHAAPDIWLVVARAGTFAGAVMVFRLGYRMTRQIAESYGELSGRRVLTIAPALLAGLIGAVALVFTGTEFYLSSNTLGYSEGLATALMLIAIERHLDGKPRQAFVVGFFVALDRPEVWVVLGRLRAVAVLARRALPGHDRRARRAPADPLVPARVLGLRSFRVERRTRHQPARQQPRLRQVPALGRAQAGGLADDVAADQVVRGAAGDRSDRRAVARSPSRRQLARGAGGPAGAGADGGRGVRVRRAGLVLDHRDRDPGPFLGQQPLPGARRRARRRLRRGRLRLAGDRARRRRRSPRPAGLGFRRCGLHDGRLCARRRRSSCSLRTSSATS